MQLPMQHLDDVKAGKRIMMMASYIDLNAVRAGLVSDSKEYRYCGYGEAVGGDKEAREGLRHVMLSLEPGKAVWGQG